MLNINPEQCKNTNLSLFYWILDTNPTTSEIETESKLNWKENG